MDPSETLLAWYDANARELPWRSDPTPYAVLLSELMLQQTRVETVKPYFARFLQRWPTLADLANADEQAVVEAWAGLGYYSRARNLHKCAVAATERGGLPDTVAELRSLPGIGPYTAGAIASIAFRRQAALVDGNVARVLSRLDGITADPASTAGKKALWARAEQLVPAGRPGDFNQALMELGATVCTPRKPRCGDCPWQASCVAFASGEPESLPRKKRKKASPTVFGATGVLRMPAGVLLGRRPAGGLLGGLWEPVRVDVPRPEDGPAALASAFASMQLDVHVGPLVAEVVHVFSHRRLQLRVHDVSYRAGEPGLGSYEAVRVGDVEDVGLSSLARKVLDTRAQPALPLAADSR